MISFNVFPPKQQKLCLFCQSRTNYIVQQSQIYVTHPTVRCGFISLTGNIISQVKDIVITVMVRLKIEGVTVFFAKLNSSME